MPFFALIKKEIYRFSSVWVQTILGPLATALLYQFIFGSQFANINTGLNHISYPMFLIPGLIMMQLLLNAFANGSSSLIQSKYTGNIIFILMAPITPTCMYLAYLIASIIRGCVVGLVVLAGIIWFGSFHFVHIPIIIFFAVVGAAITGGLGLISGIISEKFDQIAGFQSFIMVPLIYLSGIFFNVKHLSPFWKTVAMLDPFLYIVDGFRYGFIDHTNFNIRFGIIFVLGFALIINIIGVMILKRGINIKN